MIPIKPKHVRSEPDRQYFDVGEFEIRTGKFNDGSSYLNGERWEIRILSKDFELMEVLTDKIKEILSK